MTNPRQISDKPTEARIRQLIRSYLDQEVRRLLQQTVTTGLPLGGTTDQLLKKDSATDYDASWYDISAVLADGSFLNLGDTPGSYTARQMLATNAAGTALESVPVLYNSGLRVQSDVNNTMVLGSDTAPGGSGILKIKNASGSPLANGIAGVYCDIARQRGLTSLPVAQFSQTIANTGTATASVSVSNIFQLTLTDQDTGSTNVQTRRAVAANVIPPSTVNTARLYVGAGLSMSAFNVTAGATATSRAVDATMSACSQTTASTLNTIQGMNITGGAISATAGTISRQAINIAMPNDVAVSGTPTVNVDALLISGGIHLFLGGGTQTYHALNVTCPYNNYFDGNVYIGSEAGYTLSPAEGDGSLLVLGASEFRNDLDVAGLFFVDQSASAIGFFGTTPATQPPAYTPTNVTTDRSFDADAAGTAELADVLGTLIADLQSLGIIG